MIGSKKFFKKGEQGLNAMSLFEQKPRKLSVTNGGLQVHGRVTEQLHLKSIHPLWKILESVIQRECEFSNAPTVHCKKYPVNFTGKFFKI